MRISENVCMPKGYNFRAMLVVVFYYNANIQKITDISSKCIQISLCNTKFLIPNSDALPSDTIFAFLMLNTMS